MELQFFSILHFLSETNTSTYLLVVSVKELEYIFVEETAKRNYALFLGVKQTLSQ